MPAPTPTLGPAARRVQRWSTGLASAIAAVTLVSFSPFVLEGPGPVANTVGEWQNKQIMQVTGHETFPTQSRLDLTTVSAAGSPAASVSALETLWAWVDPTRDIVPREYMYPAGTTTQQQAEESAIEMTSSQQLSVLAALNELGIEYGTSTKISALATEANKDSLKADDVVVSFAGQKIDTPASLQAAVQASTGTSAQMVLKRDGKQVEVSVSIGKNAEGKPSLGAYIAPEYELPFKVDFAIENIGGPSAGTMLALGLIDKLTEGSLAGERHVAGTGTITEDGKIGAIGGIAQKVVGARDAGATVFLAPQDNCAELSGRVPEGLSVYAASTLHEAKQVLEALASESDMGAFTRCGAN